MYAGLAFAGGGNRCYWQGGFYETVAPRIGLAPKRVVGASLGVIGTFSYLGSAIQEQVSGILIERGTTTIGAVKHYAFSGAVAFWIGASVASMLLALLLWRQGAAYAAREETAPGVA